MAKAKTYTSAEISPHNSRKDLWLVYRNAVLDATKFIDEHPGGEEVLLDLAGGDISNAFEDVGHSTEALEIIQTLIIGNLKGPIGAATTIKAKPISTESNSNYFLYISIFFLLLTSYGAYKYLGV